MGTIIKKFVNYIKDDNNISISWVRILYNLIYSKRSVIRSLVDVGSLKNDIIEKFYTDTVYTSHLPKVTLEGDRKIKMNVPSVSLYYFKDAVVNIDSTGILYKDKIVVTRTDEERFNEGFLSCHNQYYGKVFYEKITDLEEGFFLGGNGSWNWFHFIIEILPKLMLLQPNTTKTLLVSEIVLKIPSMTKALDYIINENYNILYLKRNQSYHVKKLYYVNDFNHIQFNRFDHLITGEGTYYNKELTCRYSDVLIKQIPSINHSPSYLFLYRKNTHRIANNQEEILEFLKPYGFKPICMEELSFEEQVNYFKNAKFIIGISGAAWTNLLFCRNSPKAICFLTSNAAEASAFSNLASFFNVNLLHLLYENDENHYSSNFEINLSQFKLLFKSLLNEK